jgi:phenylpropionate dioxygenase-like ring-hydroxylating dioxygenase large terminal subunit
MDFSALSSLDVSIPAVPRGWYYLCRSKELNPGPVRRDLGKARYVAFRGASGRVTVLDGRCSHMGADLARGCVVDDALRCPLHAWEYSSDGTCRHIPTGGAIPVLARQAAFPSAELGGHVFFYNSPVPRFGMPFFSGKFPEELLAAEPFDLVVKTPWYMVGANAFDLQHFKVAHDRTLLDAPVVESPSPFARRISAKYAVAGTSWRDAFTRRFSGPTVRMSVTVWGGTLLFVEAAFQRTTSYGMVSIRPIDPDSAMMRTIVWVPRRGGAVARMVVDPLDAWIRRGFIRRFVMDDAVRSEGVRYHPSTAIDADRELGLYLAWLGSICTGQSESSHLSQGGSCVSPSSSHTVDPGCSDLDRAAAVGADEAGRH